MRLLIFSFKKRISSNSSRKAMYQIVKTSMCWIPLPTRILKRKFPYLFNDCLYLLSTLCKNQLKNAHSCWKFLSSFIICDEVFPSFNISLNCGIFFKRALINCWNIKSEKEIKYTLPLKFISNSIRRKKLLNVFINFFVLFQLSFKSKFVK